MKQSHPGSARTGPVGQGWAWRLAGTPAPRLPERVARVAGRHVWRAPRRVHVLAGSIDRLRDLLADPATARPARGVRVVVAYWRAPRRGWSAAVGPLPHLVRQRVALPVLGRGAATVSLRLSRPAPLRDLLRAALHALAPSHPLPEPASPDLTAYRLLPSYLPGAPGGPVVLAGDLPTSSEIRPHDIVLQPPGAPAPAEPADPPYAVAYTATRHALAGPGGPLVLVDAERINPRGRRAEAYRPGAARARLEFAPARRRAGGRVEAWRPLAGAGLDAPVLAALRDTAAVEVPPLPEGSATDPTEVAALLVQLAATGVLVHAPSLPPAVTDLITPPLRAMLATPVPAGADPLALEARSVRQRRAALRGHAAAFALPPLTASTFGDLGRLPSVSAILATRRPELLATALTAITRQTYPELEIICCPHGIELPPEARAVLVESGRPYQILTGGPGTGFGELLGTATRAARGSLITKFDDDDTYSTEHVWDLVLARHYSGATLVGKGTEFVHLEEAGITVRRSSGVPEADGELVAGGTMLLAKGDLEAVGGWRPVPRSVDYGLIERLRQAGATIYRTHPLGYVYHRRTTGHTWDPGQQYFLDSAHTRWEGIPADAIGDAEPDADGAAPLSGVVAGE
ncbi:glycosyltransferase [Micromonospora sp. NPDC049559]|uniref:glycosyltransferase n=1 Tax=Micromonospora sp. NPDC049559 TaxID=3155923 RepID=UPI00344417A3